MRIRSATTENSKERPKSLAFGKLARHGVERVGTACHPWSSVNNGPRFARRRSLAYKPVRARPTYMITDDGCTISTKASEGVVTTNAANRPTNQAFSQCILSARMDLKDVLTAMIPHIRGRDRLGERAENGRSQAPFLCPANCYQRQDLPWTRDTQTPISRVHFDGPIQPFAYVCSSPPYVTRRGWVSPDLVRRHNPEVRSLTSIKP